MKKLILLLNVFLICTIACAQNEFKIKGKIIGMRDGLSVSLLTRDSENTEEIANTTVKNGEFELKGVIEEPIFCTLITTNLSILTEEEMAETKNIRWTYTDIIVSSGEMTFNAVHYDSISVMNPIGEFFRVTGGKAQTDFNEYNKILYSSLDEKRQIDESKFNEINMTFIRRNPTSVVSLKLADDMLMNPYKFSKEQIEELDKLMSFISEAPKRDAVFRKNCKNALNTAVNCEVLSLSLMDMNGQIANLIDVVDKDKYTLVDFWASWCGICIKGLPELKEVEKKYGDKLRIIGVSADENDALWRKSIEKENIKWDHYRMTQEGLIDFTQKYRITGVPFYLLVAPDGKVVAVPKRSSEIDEIVALAIRK